MGGPYVFLLTSFGIHSLIDPLVSQSNSLARTVVRIAVGTKTVARTAVVTTIAVVAMVITTAVRIKPLSLFKYFLIHRSPGSCWPCARLLFSHRPQPVPRHFVAGPSVLITHDSAADVFSL